MVVLVMAVTSKKANVQLLINAWHAMPGGGIITVRAGTTHDGQVQLAFCDTGSGMSAAAVACAFEPFYTTKQERGTGMGLAICQQIKEVMEALGWEDRHKAYEGLKVTLWALRDRLPVVEAAHLAAQS